METKKEIETKILAILLIRRCKGEIKKEELKTFDILNKKYRNKEGHLIKGSFFAESGGTWEIV